MKTFLGLFKVCRQRVSYADANFNAFVRVPHTKDVWQQVK